MPYEQELLDAARDGDINKMKRYILQGANLEVKTEDDKTVLMEAAGQGHLLVVKWLVEEKKVSLTEKDKSGMSALSWAAWKGRLPVMKWLVEEKKFSLAEKENDGSTILMRTARKGHLSVVKWLVEEKKVSLTEKDNDGATALLWASQSDCPLPVVKWLVEEKKVSLAEKSNDGFTVLLMAALGAELPLMKWLVEENNVSLSEKTNDGDTVLMLTAVANAVALEVKLSVIKWLVEEKKVSIDEKNKNGRTALLWAAHIGRVEIVQYLVEHGADLQAKTNDGETVIDLAKKSDNQNVIVYLEQTLAVYDSPPRLTHPPRRLPNPPRRSSVSPQSQQATANPTPVVVKNNGPSPEYNDLSMNEIIQKANSNYEEGNYAEALKWYRKAAVKGDASSKGMVMDLEKMLAELTTTHTASKQEKPVAIQLKKEEKNNMHINDNKIKILSLLSQAQNEIELEEWEEATQHYEEILLLDKYHLQALIGKGKIYENQGELEKAHKCYEKAIKYNVQSNDVIGLKIARKRLEEINQKIKQQTEIKKAKEMAQQQEIAELKAQLAAKEEALKTITNAKSTAVKLEPVRFFKPPPVALGSTVPKHTPPPTFQPKAGSKR